MSYTEELKLLINRGKYRAAVRQASRIVRRAKKHDLDAHFWFAYGLATLLTEGDAEEHFRSARCAKGYSPIMEGDMLRDGALAMIRAKKLNKAAELLSTLATKGYHTKNPNRHAAYVATRARLAYARGDALTALFRHNDAHEMWRELGDEADEQWVANNVWHFFKASVMFGASYARLYDFILRDPHSAHRRKQARAIHVFGRPAIRLLEAMERLRLRLP